MIRKLGLAALAAASLSALAQEQSASVSVTVPANPVPAAALEAELLTQLRIALGSALPGSSLATDGNGALLLRTNAAQEQAPRIPIQVVSTEAVDESTQALTELADGLVVAGSGGFAFLLAPVAWNPAAVTSALAQWGDVIQSADGRLEILATTLDPERHFTATFTFRGVSSAMATTAAAELLPPQTTDTADPRHLYTLRYADGIEEVLQPIVAAPGFMASLAARQLSVRFDRNQGMLTINDQNFRPAYFVEEADADARTFLAANADGFDLAFRPGHGNTDGIVDYQIISPQGSQWLYGQP
jgi:hypothetical protein